MMKKLVAPALVLTLMITGSVFYFNKPSRDVMPKKMEVYPGRRA